MALDHSRLGVENKSGRFFCVRQVYFTKSCQKIWGCVNQPLYFLYITSEVKQYYDALYLSYKPRTECSISQFFKTNCTQSISRTINRVLLAKTLEKTFQNHLNGQPVFTFDKPSASWVGVFERILIELRLNTTDKAFIMFIFLFIWRLKTNGTAIQIARETTINQ